MVSSYHLQSHATAQWDQVLHFFLKYSQRLYSLHGPDWYALTNTQAMSLKSPVVAIPQLNNTSYIVTLR